MLKVNQLIIWSEFFRFFKSYWVFTCFPMYLFECSDSLIEANR
jgi:hypothetical protein